MTRRILVTGTDSGLGRALLDRFGTTALTRREDPLALQQEAPFDAVVHCAFDHSPDDDATKIKANLALFDAVHAIPCRCFIYISSIDVYPKGGVPRHESETVSPMPDDDPYRTIKIACEARLRSNAGQHLILRPTALLGRSARPNSLIRMMRDPQCSLSLSPASRFNYVLHEHIGHFILSALREGLNGIFNIATTGNLRLDEVAEILAARPEYGKFLYDVGDIDNRKAQSVLPELGQSSRDTVEAFMKATA